MGTRGAYGFYRNETHKVSYNHFDSYPECLGNNILDFVKRHTLPELNHIFEDMLLVNEHDLVKEGPALTRLIQRQPILMEKIMKKAPENFGSGKKDWYYVLRELQGDLQFHATLGIMTDNHEFLHDGLFCEWAYIINLDKDLLEVYRGFFKKKPKGRYRNIPPHDGYYAVGLIKTYPLDDLPEEFDPEKTSELYVDH